VLRVDADVHVQAVVRQQHRRGRAGISPWKPTNCAGFFSPTVLPFFSVTASALSTTR
jgi:hypothetical protein